MFPIPRWVYYTSCHPVHTTTDELKGNMWIRIYCPRPKGDLRPGALVGVRGLGPGWGAREGDQLPPALLVAPSRGRASAAGPSAGQVRVTPLG